jgi:Holliday junction DNA helicase RuvA
MIASLTGRLQRRSTDSVVVDVGGVGYLVVVPLTTLQSLPEPGEDVSLHIHTSLREDTVNLFGFATELEKELFLVLTGVSGIGPKLALSVLSGLSVPDLVSAITAGDDGKLCSIPGVGKKTAGRICLELKDKVRRLLPDIQPAPHAVPPAEADAVEDAISALVNLGYRRPQAEDAVRAVPHRSGMTVEDLVRMVLGKLSSKQR